MQDIGKAFTYMFEDENWLTKIIVGGIFVLLSFILIGIPFVTGYVIEIVQNVLSGKPKPLPEWTDLGNKFVKGLVLFVALIIWFLPGLALSWIGSIFQMLGDGRGALAAIGSVFSCVSFIYNLGIAFIMPAIYLSYVRQPEFVSAFKVERFFQMIAAETGGFIVVFVLSLVAGFIGALGLIALCVGVIFTGFWSQLVMAHLYGQLGRTLEQKMPLLA